MFENEFNCLTCKAQYYIKTKDIKDDDDKDIQGKGCEKTSALNCDDAKNDKECSTCPYRYYLGAASAGITSCAQFLTNCSKQSVKDVCLECDGGYLLENKVCNSTTGIDECYDYESKEKCKQCNSGYTLSVDKKKCEELSDDYPNCSNQTTSSTMNCAVCSEGYYFKDGECTAFVNNALTKGCFVADEADEKCLVCSSNYYMADDLDCHAVSTPSDPDDTDSSVIPTTLLLFLSILVYLF